MTTNIYVSGGKMGDEFIRYPNLFPKEESQHHSFDLTSFVGGIAIGTFIFGAVIWTKLGRQLAEKSIAKGAKVAETKVREWAKIGEEEE